VDLDVAVDEDERDTWNLVVPSTPPPNYRPRVRHLPPDPPPRVPVVDADNLMRVSATSSPQAVAGAIRAVIFEQNQMPLVRAIGAGAVAQACKGIAIARGQVAVRGRDLSVNIGFETVAGDTGEDISAMAFFLFLR
jgi:stage V sporulation protein S